MNDFSGTEKYKPMEKIIRKLIETLVIPKYPDIEYIRSITSEFHRGVRQYTVRLEMNKITGDSDDIVREIETLFKMASLNTQSHDGSRDHIRVFREMND
jgi:hypothetical protein